MAVQRSNLFALRKGFMSHYLQAVPCCFWRKQQHLFISEVKKKHPQIIFLSSKPVQLSVALFQSLVSSLSLIHVASGELMFIGWVIHPFYSSGASFNLINIMYPSLLLSSSFCLSSFHLFSAIFLFSRSLPLSGCFIQILCVHYAVSLSLCLAASLSYSLSTLTVSQS